MITNTFLPDDTLPNGRLLSTEALSLTPEQIDRAIQLSQLGQNDNEQWQFYLQTLALQGIQEWFQKRAPELSFHSSWLDRDMPLNRPIPGFGVSSDRSEQGMLPSFQVGNFRMNLVITDALETAEVAVSETAIARLEGMAHFYLLVEVLEEFAQITVAGYLRRDQMIQHSLAPAADGLCWLATDWFEQESDRLLLELQSLDPTTIPLTEQTVSRQGNTPSLQQQVINTGLWLRNQLDQVAQDLGWILLPSPVLSPAMRAVRSPVEQFSNLQSSLAERQGVLIPPQAKTAYKQLGGENHAFCLYIVTWELEPGDHPSEWSLMVILAAPSGTLLPANTDLQIWEGPEQLLKQRLEHPTDGGYLFAQVGGTQDEQFSIGIHFPNQEFLQLAPFGFDKNAGN